MHPVHGEVRRADDGPHATEEPAGELMEGEQKNGTTFFERGFTRLRMYVPRLWRGDRGGVRRGMCASLVDAFLSYAAWLLFWGTVACPGRVPFAYTRQPDETMVQVFVSRFLSRIDLH